MRQLHISLTNETEGYRFSEYDVPLREYLDEDASQGEIFRALQREWGRCASKVYRDRRIPLEDDGERWETQAIGWFFVSRQRYEDTNEPYLRGAWVTLQTLTIEAEVLA